MSRLVFQSKIGLQSATPGVRENEWTLEFTFADNEGVFIASDVQRDDVLVLDTGSYEPGTLTLYDVLEVVSADWKGLVKAKVGYSTYNDNRYPNPDLNYTVGVEGIIVRPSASHQLLPVTSPDTQQISDRFSFYLLNHNLNRRLDAALDDYTTLGLITAENIPLEVDGTAPLPAKPYGDFVWNQARVHLEDTSVVEVTGITSVERDGTHYVKLDPADLLKLEDYGPEAVTVSFLGKLP